MTNSPPLAIGSTSGARGGSVTVEEGCQTRTVILGMGNLLLSDEGFGVHFIRYLEQQYIFPDEVELVDAGTLGLMIAHKLENAQRVYVIAIVDAPGAPGDCLSFQKEQLLLKTLPVKLSPHQGAVEELLLLSALRGHCPSA